MRLNPLRDFPAAALAAALVSYSVVKMKDAPAATKPQVMPRPLADDFPRPSGRRHLNRLPLHDGVSMSLEASWTGGR